MKQMLYFLIMVENDNFIGIRIGVLLFYFYYY